jgi:hypothetical protein
VKNGKRQTFMCACEHENVLSTRYIALLLRLCKILVDRLVSSHLVPWWG